jgi:signal transduction histidine kinase
MGHRNVRALDKVRTAATYLLKVAALAVVYRLAASLGLMMAYVQTNTSAVWPPTGIALAALLLFGYKFWPGVSLGVLLGALPGGADPRVALGMAIGNTLEALAGAWLLNRIVGLQAPMGRLRDVVGIAVVALFSTAVSATIGTGTLALVGFIPLSGLGALWLTWWIGDLLGALVVAPALLVWLSPGALRGPARAYAEGALLLGLLSAATWYVFVGQPQQGVLHQALIYIVFPFIIWAALRLGQQGATASVCAVSGIAIWGTVHGLGPFAMESKNSSLVLLQTFTAVVSLTALILAATTIERRNAARSLRQRAEELATLHESSKTFLDSVNVASIYQTICRTAVNRLGLDAAWIEATDERGTDSPPLAVHGLPPSAIPDEEQRWGAGPDAASLTPRFGTLDPRVPGGSGSYPYQAYADFPLISSGRPIGRLKLLSKRGDFFSSDKQVLIQAYANLAAVVIQNSWLFDEVRRSNRQLHALSQRLMQTQEDERLHLSRELHDESGQLLAALSVQLGLLEREAGDGEIIRTRVAELKNTAGAIQGNLHRLAVDLRPASLDHAGLVMTLQQFIQDFSHQHGVSVDFEAVGMGAARLPIEIETAIFRIVQESLTNVALHAGASRVDVLLSRTEGHLSAIVEDNGIGFTPAPSLAAGQMGLFGMRERVEMLGGTLTVESSPGTGTTVKAEVPIAD